MSSKTITIIDYGMGNLYSVSRAVEMLGFDPVLTSDPDTILRSEKVILPGVGAFAQGMAELRRLGLIEPIRTYYSSGKPFLGICLGMQMMLEEGEEFGRHEGLGLIPGKVVKIASTTIQGEKLKVPNIGWSELRESPNGTPWDRSIFGALAQESSVYFVHSYVVVPKSPSNVLATIEYGGHQLVAAIAQNRAVGCQFHPERSGKIGLSILSSFLKS